MKRSCRLYVLLALLLMVLRAGAVEGGGENASPLPTDTMQTAPRRSGGHHLRNKFLDGLYQFVKEFSRVDTNYVEPQHYNFQLMLQNTYTFDMYSIKDKAGQEVELKQRDHTKVGPYLGWRWIFLGYMVDLKGSLADGQQDFNLSLYSNQVGVDLFYRKSGDSYVVNKVNIGDDNDLSYLEGVPFSGFESSIKGFNLYYIFNHRRFSYPAAYSMSTMQKRSTGSAIVGIGYTRHSLRLDLDAFDQLLQDNMGDNYYPGIIDSTMTSYDVTYTDYSVSGGYAYNWVIAPRLLLDISVQGALAYKHSTGMSGQGEDSRNDFDFRNFNIDGIVRMGLVYNNNKWFAGANAIMHAYNYHPKQFSASTVFGNINVYIGFNFGRRRS